MNPVVLASCILIFSALTVLANHGNFGPDESCFHFISKLKRAVVMCFRWTDHLCPKQGVLYVSQNVKFSIFEICVGPSRPWVKEIIEAKAMNNITPSK
uniref:Chemokine interleukin-8-like domain-containing protein n=1 Tax=Nothobranchius furzeri TaxID=105023 RepID=A0A8C6NHF5_NOTFU